ncbi:hypothetical protein NEOLEDRAFT_497272 [Neolentinus lepideus HHB14362 ss-1]|uniref:Uncharacterized protein n=1 Tax=Neolentinus lepideus HHB14362 ss-1 TaxID=1314782 RepID=A0A165RNF7_9AGAM|nr:hypothetical protein NEOLEDRAFT_497272 [Neolentinus lepideus HHB14362 ss-1]
MPTSADPAQADVPCAARNDSQGASGSRPKGADTSGSKKNGKRKNSTNAPRRQVTSHSGSQDTGSSKSRKKKNRKVKSTANVNQGGSISGRSFVTSSGSVWDYVESQFNPPSKENEEEEEGPVRPQRRSARGGGGFYSFQEMGRDIYDTSPGKLLCMLTGTSVRTHRVSSCIDYNMCDKDCGWCGQCIKNYTGPIYG